MRYLISILAALMLAGSALAADAPARAEGTGVYASVFGGVQFLEDPNLEVQLLGVFPVDFQPDADAGGFGGVALGYRISPMLRAELEFSGGQNEVNVFGLDVDVTTFALMANGYLDFDLGAFFVPYIGLGFGGVHIADDALDRENLVGAGQLLVGVNVPITDRVMLGAGYRFRQTFGGQLGPIDFPEGLTTHSIEARLTYSF